MTTKRELGSKAKILLTIHFLCIAIWGLATFFNALGLADAGVLDYSFFYPWIEGAKSGSWFSIFYIIYSIIIWLCFAIALPVILYAILLKFHLKIPKKVLGFAILLSVVAFLVILVSELFGAGYAFWNGIPSIRKEVKLDEKKEEWSKNLNNLEGCPVLFELGEWEMNKHWLDDIFRTSRWYQNGSYYKKTIGLHTPKSKLFSGENWLYVGPWHSASLPKRPSKDEEFDGIDEALYSKAKIGSEEKDKMHDKLAKNRKKLQQKVVKENIQETKQIRFIAYQEVSSFVGANSGSYLFTYYLYESQNKEEKTVPEKEFNFLTPTQDTYATNPFDLCFVKWVAKFGINAIADCNLTWRRFFTKDALRCTGDIIDSETKEIIAKGVTDNTGKIIEFRK